MPVIPPGKRGQVEGQPGPSTPGISPQGASIPTIRRASPRLERAIGWYLRGSMTRLLLVVCGLFVGIFLLMAQTVVAQRQARQEVMLQDESMLSLHALMEIMLDAETGQRGYLLTGNDAYLEPFERAKLRLEPEVSALKRIGERSSDAEQTHIARVQQLIRAKIAELDRTIELAKGGMLPAALALVQTNVGQQDMSRLRIELAWLRNDRARQRQAAFDRVQVLESRLLPLVGLLGVVMVTLVVVALRGERQRAWAEADARQLAALRVANEQTQLLARELNHRVKNLFSVVLSIITISARKQAPTTEVLDDIRARVHALARAHSSSQGSGAEENTPLAGVIANIMQPYDDGLVDNPASRIRLSGPEISLPARMITPMGMLIHELATNASKYGALCVESGVVDIGWEVAAGPDDTQNLVLRWIETGGPSLRPESFGLARGPAAPTRIGFGSRLTAMAAQQMGGILHRSWPETGARVDLVCPLP